MLRAVGTGLVAAVVQSRLHELNLVISLYYFVPLPPPRRICNFVVSLLATLRKNVRTHLLEIFREGWQLANEQMIKFWWRSGSRIRM